MARQLLCFKPSLINLIRTPSLKLSMPEHRNTHPVDSAPSPSGLFSSSLFTGARWTLPTEMFHVASCDTTAGPKCRPCFPREAPADFTLVLGCCISSFPTHYKPNKPNSFTSLQLATAPRWQNCLGFTPAYVARMDERVLQNHCYLDQSLHVPWQFFWMCSVCQEGRADWPWTWWGQLN